jgi:uncharacterized repeat protein (TIGR03803 family)
VSTDVKIPPNPLEQLIVFLTTRLGLRLAVVFVVLTVSLSSQAQTFIVLHRFTGSTEGARPYDALSLDQAGNIYGTTSDNAQYQGLGTVFRMASKGRDKVLHTFTGGADGAFPYSGVVQDASGNLYGTTFEGGNSACPLGCGTVYKIDSTGNKTVLYAFTGGADGSAPMGDLLIDSTGNLYGTAMSGGTVCQYGGCGTVFQIDPSGTETTLYSFTGGADGALPLAGLVRDKKGDLFGTTYSGGIGLGVIFEVTPAGQEIVLHTFRGTNDGDSPESTLLRDAIGNLYGTTSGGRSHGSVLFKVSPGHTFTPLHNFNVGDLPSGRLVVDSAGNLYGTTERGGSGQGEVFKIDTTGTKTDLHIFTNHNDGGNPRGGLVADQAGNLYGTASSGGQFTNCPLGCGAVFKITP